MAKINKKRLSALISSVFFTASILIGSWFLINNFKLFQTQYSQEYRVKYIENKYKKPYSEWLEESTKECINNSKKDISNAAKSNHNSFSWASETEKLNNLYEICAKGWSEKSPPTSEISIYYLRNNAFIFVMLIIATGFLSYVLGLLIAFWIPNSIKRFTKWLCNQ